MGVASIRQRVGRLERTGIFTSDGDYPPFTAIEIRAAGDRILAGERRIQPHPAMHTLPEIRKYCAEVLGGLDVAVEGVGTGSQV